MNINQQGSRNVEITAEKNNVSVITFKFSQFTEETEIDAMGKELLQVVADHNAPAVVLNLSRLTFAATMVLGKFIELHKKLAQQGKKLILCNITPEIKEILTLSRLHKLFSIQETSEKALAAALA